MIICGVKLTHDGGVCLIDNGKLIFSYEIEKFNNNHRHAGFGKDFGYHQLINSLDENGYRLKDIDQLVFDGWEKQYHKNLNTARFKLSLGDYGRSVHEGDIMQPTSFFLRAINKKCKSFKHVASHVCAAYTTSPFAKTEEDSFILAWDGGMFPQLFYFNFKERRIINIADLFGATVNIYFLFAIQFAPFKGSTDIRTLPGKIMAFTSLGRVQNKLLTFFKQHPFRPISDTELSVHKIFDNDDRWCRHLSRRKELIGFSEVDILATFERFIQDLLVDRLKAHCGAQKKLKKNLCLTGGAALNIIWNSAIRDSGIFENVWIPPFPNDAGNAIGAACCEMVTQGICHLDWSVYRGQPLIDTGIDKNWVKSKCSLKQLAALVSKSSEPVVFLNKNAELGPRALGNRSILAPPSDAAMKHLLNAIKEREYYRPVAPVCLEEDAPDIFRPGSPDPYMLFTHFVKSKWKKKIPAVCHLDGSARLQTVNKKQNPGLYKLLTEYKKLSGIPLLCNTSANHKGKGFFPDLKSAMDWGKVNIIYSNGSVYCKKGHSQFLYGFK